MDMAYKKITKQEFIALLDEVGWSGAELKRRVEVSPATVYKWIHGECRIPGAVVAYLKLVLLVRSTAVKLEELGKG